MTTLASATPPRRGLFTNPDYNNCNLYWIMWVNVGLSDMKCSYTLGIIYLSDAVMNFTLPSCISSSMLP